MSVCSRSDCASPRAAATVSFMKMPCGCDRHQRQTGGYGFRRYSVPPDPAAKQPFRDGLFSQFVIFSGLFVNADAGEPDAGTRTGLRRRNVYMSGAAWQTQRGVMGPSNSSDPFPILPSGGLPVQRNSREVLRWRVSRALARIYSFRCGRGFRRCEHEGSWVFPRGQRQFPAGTR